MRKIRWYIRLGRVDPSDATHSHYSHVHVRYLVGYSDGSILDMSEASLIERLP